MKYRGLQRGPEISLTGMRSLLLERLSEIRAPVLIVHGRHDTVIPISSSREAAPLIPRCSLHETEGKHVPLLEEPTTIAALIGQHFQAGFRAEAAPTAAKAH